MHHKEAEMMEEAFEDFANERGKGGATESDLYEAFCAGVDAHRRMYQEG